VDHPAYLDRELPWRTTALVASAVAAVELLVIVIVASVLLLKPLLEGGPARAASPVQQAEAKASTARKNAPAQKSSAAKLSRGETSVMVLNGNGASGAASEKADYVRTKGYAIAGTANAPRTDFARSVVMYRPGYRAEAERFAQDFGLARVAPLDGLRADDLSGAQLALVVGAD